MRKPIALDVKDQWIKLFVTGNHTQEEISQKYGVSIDCVRGAIDVAMESHAGLGIPLLEFHCALAKRKERQKRFHRGWKLFPRRRGAILGSGLCKRQSQKTGS